MPKRKKDFNIEEDCYICYEDIKDPKTNFRKKIPVIDTEGAEIKEEYDTWKKKETYPVKVKLHEKTTSMYVILSLVYVIW